MSAINLGRFYGHDHLYKVQAPLFWTWSIELDQEMIISNHIKGAILAQRENRGR